MSSTSMLNGAVGIPTALSLSDIAVRLKGICGTAFKSEGLGSAAIIVGLECFKVCIYV